MRLGYCLACLVISVPASSPAQTGVYLDLAADASGSQCHVADPGPSGLATVFVILDRQFPLNGAAGVSFAAPVPANSGLTYVGESSTFATTGNSQTGVTVGFGSCLFPSTPIVVMTMYLVRTSGGEACARYTLASPPVFQPEFYDCEFALWPLRTGDGVILNWDGACYEVAHPNPPDDASNVPLVTSLEWTEPFVCNPMLRGDPFVRFGTSADPPFFALGYSPIPVGPLAPMTTYYWSVDSGPVWSFTTTEKVATRQSTWGAIKALYR